jgi:hypothetical protein
MMNEDQEHEQEVRETKGTLLDLLIGEGPLVALVGASSRRPWVWPSRNAAAGAPDPAPAQCP